MKNKLTGFVACMALALFVSSTAKGSHSLTPPLELNPSLAVDSGDQTAQGGPSGIDSYLNLTYGATFTSTEMYKSNVGGADEKAAAGFYTTTFTPATNPTGGTIHWDGGQSIIDATYLLVKDGNQTPAWYLFEISSDWDGMTDIVLSGFWGNPSGAISHVSIYGSTVAVPEPTSIGLFALGLSCVTAGSFRRRRRA